jgi:hypothetical protein
LTVDKKRVKAAPVGKRRRRRRTTHTPPPAPPKTTSLRAYAKHREVSAEAVRKAIKSGRLKKAIVDVRGTPQIADIQLADREWAANTDLSRASDVVKTRAAGGFEPQRAALQDAPLYPPSALGQDNQTCPPGFLPPAASIAGRETDRGRVLTFGEAQGHGGELKRQVLIPDDSIAAASAQEKHWRAKKAELDYKRAAGELVNAQEISARLADLFTTCRTRLLGLPTKAKSQLPHLTLGDISVLDGIVRESLDGLATESVDI